jgi:hypothetical protein
MLLAMIPRHDRKLINNSHANIFGTNEHHPTFATQVVFLSVVLFSSLVFNLQYNEGHGKAFAQSSDTTSNAVSSGAEDSHAASLRSSTTHGTYTVELDWRPKSIGVGTETTFEVRFLDKSGVSPTYKIMNYDFTVAGSDLSPIQEFYNQTTDGNGIGKPLVVHFEKQGPIEVTVWVNSPEPNANSESESATFDMTVTPEFPLGLSTMAVSGGAMAGLVAVLLNFGRHKMHSGRSFN